MRRKFGVIFLDGPHDEEGTTEQLEATSRLLKKGGYIILDDTNWQAVRDSAAIFFSAKDFELVFWKRTEKRTDPLWWNGAQVWKRKQV